MSGTTRVLLATPDCGLSLCANLPMRGDLRSWNGDEDRISARLGAPTRCQSDYQRDGPRRASARAAALRRRLRKEVLAALPAAVALERERRPGRNPAYSGFFGLLVHRSAGVDRLHQRAACGYLSRRRSPIGATSALRCARQGGAARGQDSTCWSCASRCRAGRIW